LLAVCIAVAVATEVSTTLEAVREEEKEEKGDEMDLLNLAPRKIDWDLKRDIAKKLEKLERRTNRSIVEILQKKVAIANDPDA
jgi:coiled-coil domain-containing protein 12